MTGRIIIYMKRKCNTCGVAKFEDEMVPKRNWCRDCKKAYMRSYNQTPERIADRKARKPEDNRKQLEKLIAWYDGLRSQPCTDCKQSYHIACMEWDHLPEFVKNTSPKATLYFTKSKVKTMEEISKCELVCANCHNIRTYNRRIGAVGDKVRSQVVLSPQNKVGSSAQAPLVESPLMSHPL